MRELGHEFVGRALSDDELHTLGVNLRTILDDVRDAPARVRELSRDSLEEFTLTIPTFDELGERQLFSDSFVAGAANPMGLAAQLWRDGDVACMQVTLGKAFEGAPGRAHGGVVAALLDEVMGLMNVIHGAMAFTCSWTSPIWHRRRSVNRSSPGLVVTTGQPQAVRRGDAARG